MSRTDTKSKVDEALRIGAKVDANPRSIAWHAEFTAALRDLSAAELREFNIRNLELHRRQPRDHD